MYYMYWSGVSDSDLVATSPHLRLSPNVYPSFLHGRALLDRISGFEKPRGRCRLGEVLSAWSVPCCTTGTLDLNCRTVVVNLTSSVILPGTKAD